MQDQLGLNIVLFKIKDTDFDFTPYGLTDRYFRIDVTENINASKAVKFTDYPLLDGTTRIDTISKAPGTLSFQGKIGDLFSSPDYTHSIKASGAKSRMQLSIELLETLRDEAIVLDVLTQSKTFVNYLIESVSFTNERFGVNTVNFTLREFIAFGEDLSDITEKTLPDDTSIASFQVNSLVTNNFTNDEEMMYEIYRLISEPNISPSYVIKFGTQEINPDVFVASAKVKGLPYVEIQLGFNPRTHTYHPTEILNKLDAQTLTSGYVKDNISIKIEIDQIEPGVFTQEETIDKFSNFNVPVQMFTETPKYEVKIQLYMFSNGEDKPLTPPIIANDFMISPRFSNIDSTFNPLEGKATIENDPIITYGDIPGYIYAINFMRKYKTTLGAVRYKAVPNLLQNKEQGYMYPIFYYTKRSIPKVGVLYYLNIGFVYLHPAYAAKIQERFISDAESNSNHLFRGKTVTWW